MHSAGVPSFLSNEAPNRHSTRPGLASPLPGSDCTPSSFHYQHRIVSLTGRPLLKMPPIKIKSTTPVPFSEALRKLSANFDSDKSDKSDEELISNVTSPGFSSDDEDWGALTSLSEYGKDAADAVKVREEVLVPQKRVGEGMSPIFTTRCYWLMSGVEVSGESTHKRSTSQDSVKVGGSIECMFPLLLSPPVHVLVIQLMRLISQTASAEQKRSHCCEGDPQSGREGDSE